MTAQLLLTYATKHGSTREVAEAIAETLDATILPAAAVDDLAGYDGVVLGGSLYMGRWHPEAVHFLERHRRSLAELPVAIFALGPSTMDAGDVAQSREQLDRALAKVPEVDPVAVTIFGGAVDPRKLRFPLSKLPASDARDWEQIRRWAGEVAAAFGYGKAASTARDPRSELQQTPR